ncbi:class I adenylate-forming enzyme family protein [Peribacillus frigoritolerans]|uniref:class I adenylate-forming enzyme family protein n=1 Tax=Peribacillus frigoritolerans TaxID=450367 RepID=UPI00222F84CD|nr:AMP-binding protein [Peribacillus frigoritolerans]UZD48187.1 AMP-binding protein [Peribacillus frigoritolerans]
MDNLTYQAFLFNGINKFDYQPALTCIETNETITYKELRDRVDTVANQLIRLGVKIGTHVAVIVPNSIENVIYNLGVSRCGATVIPLNDKLGVRESEFILRNAEPQVVIMATQKHVETVHDYLKEADKNSVTVIGLSGFGVEYPDEFHSVDLGDTKGNMEFPVASLDDLATISYTGGTTGTPKGVMHSQQGFGASIMASCMEYPYDDQDKVLFCTPLIHSAGVLLQRSLVSGCHVYIMRSFNPEVFLQTVQEARITSTFIVPTIIYRLIEEAKKKAYEVSSLRNINYGSSPISTERLKEAFEIFGPIFRQQYGMTECSILIARLTKSDHIWAYENNPEVLKSCGKPCMFTQVRLIDNNGNDVKPLQPGEIAVKIPSVSVGYYKKPDLTQEAFRDGWFYTGDIGKLDKYGFLHIIERKKDMIISGGLNVYPAEVERIINQHPAVSMSACIGIPHDDWGEAVSIFAVLREGETCSKEELIQFCKERTSNYMVPKEIYIETSLPLTPVGKIDKKELKKPFWEGTTRVVN